MNSETTVNSVVLIVSIAAFLVGLSALIVSIWQGFETRKNYRLSVTPFIEVRRIKNIDTKILKLSLVNQGIGPAIIKGIWIEFYDKKFNFITEFSDYYGKFLEELNLKNKCYIEYVEFDHDMFLPANEEIVLFGFSEISVDDYKRIQDLIENNKMTVEYESIYGETFTSKPK